MAAIRERHNTRHIARNGRIAKLLEHSRCACVRLPSEADIPHVDGRIASSHIDLAAIRAPARLYQTFKFTQITRADFAPLTDTHHGLVFSLIGSRPIPTPCECTRRSHKMTWPSIEAVIRMSGLNPA